jgi:hypothetical protein
MMGLIVVIGRVQDTKKELDSVVRKDENLKAILAPIEGSSALKNIRSWY